MFSLPAARQVKDMSTWGEAWDKRLIDENIGFYTYEEFDNVKEIADGSFGKIYSADWKTSDKVVILKSFGNYNQNARQVVKDLKALNCEHVNFIRLYGLTKIENKDEENTSKYFLILEHANSGTLRQYLKDRVQTFDWHIRLNFSLQICGAVQFLHEKNIVHGGLHPNNILVIDNSNIRVTDHGISRRLTNFNIATNVDQSLIPYIDPQCFKVQDDKNKPRQFRMNMKSDIYSLGFILWELTSDTPPFANRIQEEKDLNLIAEISRGLREKPVPGTPGKFVEVYIKCWQDDPAKRSEIQQTVFALKALEIKKRTSMSDQNYHSLDFDVKNRLSIGTDISSLRNMLGQLALTHSTEQSVFRSKPLNLDPLLTDSTTTAVTTTTSTTLNTPTRLTLEPSEMDHDIPNEQSSLNVTATKPKTENNNEAQRFEKEKTKASAEEPVTVNGAISGGDTIDTKKQDYFLPKPENVNSKVTTAKTTTIKKSPESESTTKPVPEQSKNTISSNISSTPPSKKVESLVSNLDQKIVKPDIPLIKDQNKTKVEFSESKMKKTNKEEPQPQLPPSTTPSIDKNQNSRSIDNISTKETKDSSSPNGGGVTNLKKRFSISLNNNNNDTISKLNKAPIVTGSHVSKLKTELENSSVDVNDKTEKEPLDNHQPINKLNKDSSLLSNGLSTSNSSKETTATANKPNYNLGNSVKNSKENLESLVPKKPDSSTKSENGRRSVSPSNSENSSKGDNNSNSNSNSNNSSIPKLSRRTSVRKSNISTRNSFLRLRSVSPPKIPDFTLKVQPLPKNETDLSEIIVQRMESALTIKSSSKSKLPWISENQFNPDGSIDRIDDDPIQIPIIRKGKFVPKKFIDEIYNILVQSTDSGKEFYEINKLITSHIKDHDYDTFDILYFLTRGRRKPHYKSLLGYLHYAGIGTEENNERALDLFLTGAKNAIPIAQFYLAKCYQFGYGTSRNDKLTFFWYRKAAFYGSAAGENELGYCYRDGIGAQVNFDRALEWFSRSAKRGNLEGLCNVGTCYELGRGVKKNLKKAFEIYTRTAEAGFKEGQYNLAAFYEAGTGTQKDLDQAIYWCRKAASTGFRRAKEKLAKLLAQKQSDEASI